MDTSRLLDYTLAKQSKSLASQKERSDQNGRFYRRPRPRPRPRPLPAGAEAALGTTDFRGASSTNKASKFKLSGSNQDRIVEPRTERVVYATGFFPRLSQRMETRLECIVKTEYGEWDTSNIGSCSNQTKSLLKHNSCGKLLVISENMGLHI